MKRAIIIAGPNGAGKTTFAKEFLPHEGECLTYLNADLIAAGLSPLDPDAVAWEASHLMLSRIERCANKGESFAFETTLSARSYVHRIRRWRQSGYYAKLVFLYVSDVEIVVERVRMRVAEGGHSVPEAVIRQRYHAGLRNLDELYKPIVDEWMVFDNSRDAPQVIDAGSNS